MVNNYRMLAIEGIESKNINQRIAECRKMCGYTQAEMAMLLGISINTYARIERNEDIAVSMLYKISEILRVEPYLFLPIYNTVERPEM